MDYMLASMAEKNGHEYHKFELKRDHEWMHDLSYSGNKTAKAIESAELIIDA